MSSTWQPRRVLITHECVSFALVDTDEETDRIPLIGVDIVKEHSETDDQDGQPEGHFCIRVGTSAEGYNSGRTYTLRIQSQELYDDTLPLLMKLTANAKAHAEADTLYRKL